MVNTTFGKAIGSDGKTTINGGDGRVRFVQDLATGKMTLSQGDNVATFDLPNSRSETTPLIPSPYATSHLSDAERWLVNLEAEQKALPPTETFHLGGRDWYVLRGDSEDITQAGLWSARDASGKLNLLEEGTFKGMMAAFFFKFLVQGINDKRRLFETYAAAYKQASSTHKKVIATNLQLFAEIVRLNPALMPREEGSSPDNEEDASPLEMAQGSLK